MKQEENEQRSRRRKTENVVKSKRDKFKWNQWQRTKKKVWMEEDEEMGIQQTETMSDKEKGD